MANTFLFHPTVNEVVPFSAQYKFPSQATRSTKRTVKLTPKNNASQFISGTTIRFEFPSSGYLNPSETYLAFNARINVTAGTFTAGTTNEGGVEFQQNIASIFRRVRVLYGSLVLEDIQDYNILQRIFTDTLSNSATGFSNTSIYQGIGFGSRNTQLKNILNWPQNSTAARTNHHVNTGDYAVAVGEYVQRYAIPINTGLFQQRKLLPLKFMASQLQVEFEIADAADCVTWILGQGGTPTVPTACQVAVGLPEMVCELLDFDSEFDQAVFSVLGTGLPIQFQSWHMTSQNIVPTLNVQLNIQETARSVRYALCALTDDSWRTITKDAHAFVHAFDATQSDATINVFGEPFVVQGTTMQSYQWRVGGTYYPSQPVPVYGQGQAINTAVDAAYAGPPVEAYAELMKVFNNLFGSKGMFYGQPGMANYAPKFNTPDTNGTARVYGFVIAGDFLTDRGDTIGGINAEEQNDMALILKFNGTAGTNKVAHIAVCYDNLIILGENNNLVLVN